MSSNRVALVTGAGSGIGRAVALAVEHVWFLTVMATTMPFVERG